MATINIDPSISLGGKSPPAMTLSDMLNLARGAQAYRQAEQLNPVELERATAEKNVAVGTAQPRIQRATLEADEAALGLQLKILSSTRSEIAELIKRPNLSYNDIEASIVRTVQLTKAPEEIKRNAILKALADFSPTASTADLRSALAGALVKTTSAEQQLSSRLPSPTQLELGGTTIPVSPGNQLVTGVIPGTQTGTGYTKTPPPQFQQTETGLVGQFGGGLSTPLPAPAQNLFTAPPQPGPGPQPGRAAPLNTPARTGAVSSATSPAAKVLQSERQGPLQITPGETVEAYKARVAEVSKLPKDAADALNPKNVESIPNMEYTNDKIIKLLESPSLKIGPIAKAISEGTRGVGLSAEQQEIMKYLEQRIRQEGSRSNQDQESQRSAFGNFGTNKDALRTIIYNDKAILAAQRLFSEGIKKAQGNPNRPNLGAINVFRDRFNELAGDPEKGRDLMHYIGILGNKSFDKLSATDRNQLRVYFADKSQDVGLLFDDLEKRRDELLKLVRGGQ
jgi:hypothetical protein